ncbi:MFS transporter [Brevibacillus dissolubilis]|uniref:MFS transporter n=1 Tax=Brevibacillus dissolubilis TaxID=1844116 RepID=UPI001116E51C|nr:MFS transporter [Brevibacillus dissolubilis]
METKSNQPKPNGEKLLRVLAVTLVFSVMNASMFNVVLPVISAEFNLTPSKVSWILTGYMILYAIGSVTFGKLADKYRLKDLLTFGLIFFALGSIVGLMATEYWMIILGRVLQAAGASVIPATAMIIPIRYFPPETRGRALGTTAIGLALGAALGPIVSGVVTSVASWRFLFFLSVLPLITLPFFRKYLDDDKGADTKIDYLGGGLLAGTVSILLLAITQGNLVLGAVGAVLLILFIWRIRTADEPFIQPALFKNKSYTVGLIVAFLATSVSFGLPFITPQFLAKVNQLPPATIGLIMFPGAVAAAILGRQGGRLADEKGNPFLIYMSATFIFVGFILLSTFVGMSPYLIMVFLVLGSVGLTFMQIALSNTISRQLTREQTGVGMGLFSMLNFIAGATSTTLIGKMLDYHAPSFHLNPVPSNPNVFIYSNIFVVLAFMVLIVAALYRVQFGSASAKGKQPSKA